MAKTAAAKTSTTTAAKKTATKTSAAPAKVSAKSPAKPVAKTPAKAAKKTAPAKKATTAAAKAPAKAASKTAATRAPTKAAGTKAAGTKAAGTKAAGTKAPTKAAGTKAAGTKAAGTKAAGTKAAGTKESSLPAGWSAKELAAVRADLEGQLAQMRADYAQAIKALDDLQTQGADSAGDDQADAGSKTFEREHEMSLANNRRDLIVQLEHAVERIDASRYGLCESCGNPIAKARLQAFPGATLCVTCKQREERR